MTERKAGLWGEFQETYSTYLFHSFTPNPPERPLIDHWKAEGERTALIFLGMPLLSVVLFRLRNSLLRCKVPLIPYLCEMISTTIWGVSIGRLVDIGQGLIIPHGQVIINGIVNIGHGCSINPWVTIGLSGSRRWGFDRSGPTIGNNVYIGTGAKILGPVTIGDDVRIGANAVVIDDVPAGATVVGVPARVVQTEPPDWSPFLDTKSD